MKKERWIGFLQSHPTSVKWGYRKNAFNKTPGHLPKETFSQRGRLGLRGPVSQTIAVLREGHPRMEGLPHSPNSATLREVTPPHATHPAPLVTSGLGLSHSRRCHLSWDREQSLPIACSGHSIGDGLLFEALKKKLLLLETDWKFSPFVLITRRTGFCVCLVLVFQPL